MLLGHPSTFPCSDNAVFVSVWLRLLCGFLIFSWSFASSTAVFDIWSTVLQVEKLLGHPSNDP